MSRRITRLLSGIVFPLLAACGGGGDDSTAPPPATSGPPTPPPVVQREYGPYFFGSIRIGTRDAFFAEALLARDGTLRVRVGPQGAPHHVFAQFVATIPAQEQFSGTGTVLGQGCASSLPNPYCGSTASAQITGRFFGTSRMRAEVSIDSRQEIWLLELNAHSLFTNAVAMEMLSGAYLELLAEFAQGGDTIVNVDANGRLFFQSPGSGCVGNGELVERTDGSHNIFDVALTIASCHPRHAHLNRDFRGIATPIADGWDYGSFLLEILLATPDGSPEPTAITMSGRIEF